MRVEKKEEKYYLYWIKRKIFTDMRTQGYIGVTFDPKRRYTQHKSKSKNDSDIHLYRAMRKYKDIEFKVICIGSFDYICELERQLRPKENIGWNIYPGGSVAKGFNCSKEAIQKTAIKNCKYTKLQALNILVDYYEKGFRRLELSEKYNIGEWTIWSIVNNKQKAYPDLKEVFQVLRKNKTFKSNHCGQIPEDLYDKILTNREMGLSWFELEKMFDIPKMTIRGYCDGKLEYLKKFSCYRVVKPQNQPKIYTYKGKSQTIGEWSKEFDIKLATLWARIKRGWSIEKTLETPVRKTKCQ